MSFDEGTPRILPFATRPTHLQTIDASMEAEDQAAFYDKWAPSYDDDLKRTYVAPQEVASRVAAQAGAGAKILDVGAGTGLFGAALVLLRPDVELHGIDISPKMLALAQGKGCYKSLALSDVVRDGITHRQAPFDVVVAVGVFGPKHLMEPDVQALLGAARPGGLVYFTIHPCYFDEPFRSRVVNVMVSSELVDYRDGQLAHLVVLVAR